MYGAVDPLTCGVFAVVSSGRDHHNTGFSMWVAGGGFKGGTVYGATDPIGLKVVDKPVHFRDLHASAPRKAPPNGSA